MTRKSLLLKVTEVIAHKYRHPQRLIASVGARQPIDVFLEEHAPFLWQ
jgi:hypothetical protein